MFAVVVSVVVGVLVRNVHLFNAEPYPDFTTAPERSADIVQVVAELPTVPGNIAVNRCVATAMCVSTCS